MKDSMTETSAMIPATELKTEGGKAMMHLLGFRDLNTQNSGKNT